MNIIKAIPTNIITGALGVGKTTLIKQLLASKPSNERWAVLVNEFGEVGIDGAMMQNASKNDAAAQDIFIREVPGGCMCCTSGLPMHIALNQLLMRAKPHRLLIEPTGLGHPKEVIETLLSEHYRQVIKLQTTLCLVDARKTTNQRWREHATFKEQFEVADIIVMTKSELYTDKSVIGLNHYLTEIGCDNTPVKEITSHDIELSILQSASKLSTSPASPRKHLQPKAVKQEELSPLKQSPLKQASMAASTEDLNIEALNIESIIRKQHAQDGFHSRGWIWPPQQSFDYSEVINTLKSLDVIRLKALLITNKGIFAFNGEDEGLNIQEYDEALDSRLEIIVDSEDVANKMSDKIEELCLTI